MTVIMIVHLRKIRKKLNVRENAFDVNGREFIIHPSKFVSLKSLKLLQKVLQKYSDKNKIYCSK